ncbi:MAG: HlyU family transcriptional regulator [Rhodospirillales bacterium]|nr:HlyU family transcriptional regulator [Rhodospirillales bacterium]
MAGRSGFFSRLFGGGGNGKGGADGTPLGEAVDYQGYSIQPVAKQQGGQWLTAGVISKEIDGEVREHRFIRADTHSDKDDAAAMAIEKGKRIVEEQGERMFEPPKQPGG